MISIPEALSVDAMLMFTVLTPYYSKVCSQSCFCVFLVIKEVNGGYCFLWLSLFSYSAFVTWDYQGGRPEYVYDIVEIFKATSYHKAEELCQEYQDSNKEVKYIW